MRILIAIPLVLVVVLGACNVSKNGNSVSVQYDQNTAENTAAAVGNTAQDIAGDIGNDVQKTGDKIQNKVGNTNVSITTNKNENTENKSDKKSK